MDIKALLSAVRIGQCSGVACAMFLVAIIAILTFDSQSNKNFFTVSQVLTGHIEVGPDSSYYNVNDEKAAKRSESVHVLLEAIRHATQLAAGGEVERTWFTEEARHKWNLGNPCLSRKEMSQRYAQRKSVPDLEPNPSWQAVLKEYSKLHRTCIHRVVDPTSYFSARNTSINCKFTVLDTERVGLGNRMLMIASVLVYSVVTQRVLLIAGSTEVMPPDILCEPFEGSSWLNFDRSRNMTPYRGETVFWNLTSQVHDRIDAAQRFSNSSVPILDYAIANGNGIRMFQPDSRFYCDGEQKYYSDVTWVYITGCLYFLPKLFSIPSFRPALDALFPDRMVLTHVLRTVLLPSDVVWARIKRIKSTYLREHDKVLGVHVRYRYSTGHFRRMHETIEQRVLQCANENGLLPTIIVDSLNISQDETKKLKIQQPHRTTIPRLTTVFVASLYEGMKTSLLQTYLGHPTTTGESVAVVQLSNNGHQLFGSEIDQQGLAEAIVLSFSDYLFVTPMSTFSGIAQAYGGLLPWFIDFRENGQNAGACTRAKTVDVCFQVPFDRVFKCRYDYGFHGKSIYETFPDIQECLDVDTAGMQLITQHKIR